MTKNSAASPDGGEQDIQSTASDQPLRRASAVSRRASAGLPSFPVLLSDEQAAACLGVSTRKFHYMRDEAWMPRPVTLGPRMLRWPRAELEQAVANMPRQQASSPEPRQLLRSRIERMKKGGAA